MNFIKQITKSIVSYPWLSHLKANQRFVFLYHDISEKSDFQFSPHYSTENSQFLQQIKMLQQHFNLVDLDTLYTKNLPSNINYASIVFDDGFYSVFTKVFPLFQELGIPFKIFVNKMASSENRIWFSDIELFKNNDFFLWHYYDNFLLNTKPAFEIFKNDPHLIAFKYNNYESKNPRFEIDCPKIYCDTNDLKEMAKSNLVTLSSHSATHFVMANCSDEILKKEIVENSEFLATIGVKKDLHFAIPFGKKEHFDARLLTICKNQGYRYIYSTNPNSIALKNCQNELNTIPRIGISTHSINELFFMINRTMVKNYSL
jgi:peptidoglycan/xylan/chitin deacetylase (PgdA/CDA1 family)